MYHGRLNILSAIAKAEVQKIDIRNHTKTIVEEEVAVEAPANIYINKKHLVTLLSSPSMLNELAVGHLFSEGILQTMHSIDELLIAGTDIHVKLKTGVKFNFNLNRFGKFVSSACGSLVDYLQLLSQINSKIARDTTTRREFPNYFQDERECDFIHPHKIRWSNRLCVWKLWGLAH